MKKTLVKVFCFLLIIVGCALTAWGAFDIFKPEVTAGILVESEWTLGADEAMGTVGFTMGNGETELPAEAVRDETELEVSEFGASSVVAPASDNGYQPAAETQTEGGVS